LGTAILAREELSPRLRELTILLVGRRSPAPYEWTQHVPIARATGATDEQIAAVERGALDAACFDGRERALLAAAAELLEHPRLGDGSLATLERMLSPPETLDLLRPPDNYTMTARRLGSPPVDTDPPAGTAVVDSTRCPRARVTSARTACAIIWWNEE